MDVESASEQLVHEVLAMVIRKILPRVNNSMHIRLHQIRNNINILVPFGSWWLLNVHEADDVFMIKKFYKILSIEVDLLSNFISLTILLASIKSSKAFGTFLIATLALIL